MVFKELKVLIGFLIVLCYKICILRSVEVFWKEWRGKKTMFSSAQQWWDLGKKQIQQLCVQYNFNVTQNMVKKNESSGKLDCRASKYR